MPDNECFSGNSTFRQAPQTICQASYESKRMTQLDRDVVTNLMFQREDWIASKVENTKVSGYIQINLQIPFAFSFYLEQQVHLFISYCRKNNGGVLNFDATGSLIQEMKG